VKTDKKSNRNLKWTQAIHPATGQKMPDLMVSNSGQVKSLRRARMIKNGDIRIYKEKILTPTLTGSGYCVVRGILLHRLIIASFNGRSIKKGFVVHHRDNNPKNNKLENLVEVTPSENNKAKNRKGNYRGKGPGKWRGLLPWHSLDDEIWCKVPSFENYAVSNLGRVAGLKRNCILRQTTVNGYQQVSLSNGKRKYTKWAVHRLVFHTFKGTIPATKVIHHIDHNKSNNALVNLSCETYSGNTKAAILAEKLTPHGKTVNDKKALILDAKSGVKVDELLQKHGYSRSHTLKILREYGPSAHAFHCAEKKATAVKMYKEGKDYNQIARVTGLPKGYLPKLMHRKGLSTSRLVSADKIASVLNDLYNEPKMTLNQIAKKHDISKPVVCKLNKDQSVRTMRVGKMLQLDPKLHTKRASKPHDGA
jgi:hypothetical protein